MPDPRSHWKAEARQVRASLQLPGGTILTGPESRPLPRLEKGLPKSNFSSQEDF